MDIVHEENFSDAKKFLIEHSQLSHIQSLCNNLTHISATFQPQTGVEQEFLWHLFCTSPHSAIKLHFKLFSTVSYTCFPVNCFQLFRMKNELQYNWATDRKNVQNNRILVLRKKNSVLWHIFSLVCCPVIAIHSSQGGKCGNTWHQTVKMCRITVVLRKNAPHTLTVNNSKIVLNCRPPLSSPKIWVIETQQSPSFPTPVRQTFDVSHCTVREVCLFIASHWIVSES